MRPILSVSVSLAVLAMLPPSLAAQGTVYSGVVVAQGQPVAGAQVWLRYYRTSP